MCGTKLETANQVPIDDEDLLGLDPVSLHKARLQQDAQIALVEQREANRSANSRPAQRANQSSLTSLNLSPETTREKAAEESRPTKRVDRAAAAEISGPSFLGLGHEAGNSELVYDNPRDDGFVYDTPGDTPEYLLTEVSRGVSWRAWALFLLLLIGAGLGYIQWRASRNEGPDIAAILSLNGAAVSSSGPTMSGNAKSAAQPTTPTANSSNTVAAQTDADTNSSNSNTSSTKTASDTSDLVEASKVASDPKTPSAKPTDNKTTDNKTNENNDSNSAADKAGAPASTKKASAKDGNEDAAAKTESNDPDTNVTKPNRTKPTLVEEEASQPKSLGEKDPLIIKAEKYIQGHGVRKNCSTGINLLRQAVSEGNPEADVKMGALYWSGTCVTQNKVAAYEWFSRAHSLEPKNRWIERSRNSLWANMTPAEKQRTSY